MTTLTNRIYPANHAAIQYTGRVDFSNPQQPMFSAAGVSVDARFHGTSVAVLLADQFRYDCNNYYDVLIDDVLVLKLKPQKSVTKYLIASDLPNTEHSISVVKRTEANIGYCEFLGFEFGGEILPALVKPSRRMLFIGDSISCGSGNEATNESAQCAEDGWGQPYGNARLAFGPIAARHLNAEAHIIAIGGIGMVRNYSFQYDPRPLPAVYDLIFVEQVDSPIWDHNLYVPDAIVIGLGTNDFSPGESERPVMQQDIFVGAYIAFVEKMRQYYPEAHIFCISSSMLNDGWPEPIHQFATDQKQCISKVVDHYNQKGDAKIHKFFVSNFAGAGCGVHPDAEQHAFLASELEPFIAKVMGW